MCNKSLIPPLSLFHSRSHGGGLWEFWQVYFQYNYFTFCHQTATKWSQSNLPMRGSGHLQGVSRRWFTVSSSCCLFNFKSWVMCCNTTFFCFACDIRSSFLQINMSRGLKRSCPFLHNVPLYLCDIYLSIFIEDVPLIWAVSTHRLEAGTLWARHVSSGHTHTHIQVFGKQEARATPSPVLAFALARIHHCWQKSITTNCWMSIVLRSDMATKATNREYARVTAESRVASQAGS